MDLLWVFVIEGWTQEVIQQEKGSPPHLSPLPPILKFCLMKHSKTEERRANSLDDFL